MLRLGWAGAAFAVPALLLSTVALPYFYGDAAKWVVLYASVGLTSLLPVKLDRIDLAALAVVAWACVSLAWSPDPAWGGVHALNMLVGAALFIGLRRYDGPVTVGVALAVAGTLLMTSVLQFGSFGNENFITEFLLIAAPYLVLWRRLWPLLGVTVFYLVFINDSSLELVALAAVGAWFIWSRWGWKAALAASAALAVAAFAIYDQGFLRDSIGYRLSFWANTGVMWATAPLFGHGLGSFNYLYPDYAQATDFGIAAASNAHEYVGAAHNEFLQFMAEMGVVGVGLALVFLKGTVRRPDSPLQSAALVSLLIAAALAMVEFPLQNPATLALIALGLAQLSPTVHYRPLRPIKWAFVTLSIVAVAAGVFMSVGQWHFARAAAAETPRQALVEMVHSYNAFPADIQSRLMLFRLLARVQAIEQVPVNTDLAEGLYAISRSAIPGMPQLLIDRVGYLVRVGRCEEECGQILERLTRVSGDVVQVREIQQEIEG